MRETGGARWLLLQHRAFDGDRYDLTFYVIEDRGDEAVTHVMRTRYYAVTTDRLMALMREAGFTQVERLDDAFFQPLLVGMRGGVAEGSGLQISCGETFSRRP